MHVVVHGIGNRYRRWLAVHGRCIYAIGRMIIVHAAVRHRVVVAVFILFLLFVFAFIALGILSFLGGERGGNR